MLEPTACSVQAEPEGTEGAAQGASRPPLLGLRLEERVPKRRRRWRRLLVANIWRTRCFAHISTLDVQEVAACTEGADAERAEGAAGDVPAAALGRTLLGRVVDEQAAAAVVTVAGGVVTAAQLGLVLRVAERNVELVEAVGELAALGVLAEAGGRVAGAELRLIAGGADPGDEGRGGGIHQGKEGLGQGEASTFSTYTTTIIIIVSIQPFARQQVVHQLLVLAGRQEQVVAAGLRRTKVWLHQLKHQLPWMCQQSHNASQHFLQPLRLAVSLIQLTLET